MSEEYFDVVDEEDGVIGRRPGMECVRQGILHRAIAILLFNDRGEVYVQRRADSMVWYPGRWTLSVMGHVASGETYEQAARRELMEELGVECGLRPVGKVKTPTWAYGGLTEREFLSVFEGRATRPRITLSEETKEGRFVEFDGLAKMVEERSDEVTPDTLLAFDLYQGARRTKSGVG